MTIYRVDKLRRLQLLSSLLDGHPRDPLDLAPATVLLQAWTAAATGESVVHPDVEAGDRMLAAVERTKVAVAAIFARGRSPD